MRVFYELCVALVVWVGENSLRKMNFETQLTTSLVCVDRP